MRQVVVVVVVLAGCSPKPMFCGKRDRQCSPDPELAAIYAPGGYQGIFEIHRVWCFMDDGPLCSPTRVECEEAGRTCFPLTADQFPVGDK